MVKAACPFLLPLGLSLSLSPEVSGVVVKSAAAVAEMLASVIAGY